MCKSDGMYNDWSPFDNEVFDDTENDVNQDMEDFSDNARSAGSGKVSRDHSGLCRRGHAGHRR